MSYKHLGDDYLHALLPLVKGLQSMQFFVLSYNAITDAHMGCVATKLRGHEPLLGLDLTANPNTERGIAAFNRVSLWNRPDNGLRLRDDLQAFKPITDHSAYTAMRAEHSAVFELTRGTAMRVACSKTSKGATAVQALADEPGILRHMRHLDLSGKCWQHADIQRLAEMLKRDGMRLTRLDFSDSKLPAGGVTALAQAFESAHRLEALRLTGVPVDPEGDARLLELVQNTATLAHIAGSNMPRTAAVLFSRSCGGVVGIKLKPPDGLTTPIVDADTDATDGRTEPTDGPQAMPTRCRHAWTLSGSCGKPSQLCAAGADCDTPGAHEERRGLTAIG